jgi:hypothetical protein
MGDLMINELPPREFNDDLNGERATIKDDFELVYLRHRYFKASPNPEPSRYKALEGIAINVAKTVHRRFKEVFSLVGFELEDVQNIARCHLVSYLGLFSSTSTKKKWDKFMERHKDKYGQESEPSSTDLLKQDTAKLSVFIRQRIEECAMFCSHKASNIQGIKKKEFCFLSTQELTDEIINKLMRNTNLTECEGVNIERISLLDYNTLKKNMPNKIIGRSFFLDGFYYTSIIVPSETPTEEKLKESGWDYSEYENSNPETLLIEREAESDIQRYKEEFLSSSMKERRRLLKSFLKNNRRNPNLKDAISLANSIIKQGQV